eukprot:13178353-Ditylum_brightwellii.AAC.1
MQGLNDSPACPLRTIVNLFFVPSYVVMEGLVSSPANACANVQICSVSMTHLFVLLVPLVPHIKPLSVLSDIP